MEDVEDVEGVDEIEEVGHMKYVDMSLKKEMSKSEMLESLSTGRN